MRKKLDTRFPAARIKKIMQADEDVGKIALAVPVLVSKALELFLQDLCDRTYSITVDRGVKTLNSTHLKQCVHSFQVFDFLRDVVSKVPDLGGLDAGSGEKSAKKRKLADEDNDSEEEAKRRSMEAIGPSSSRGRGKGRVSGRGSRSSHGTIQHDDSLSEQNQDTADDVTTTTEHREEIVNNGNKGAAVRDFDLNLDLNECEDAPIATASMAVPATISDSNEHMIKHEEYPGWSVDKMNEMAVDPSQFASAYQVDEEDYDVEDG